MSKSLGSIAGFDIQRHPAHTDLVLEDVKDPVEGLTVVDDHLHRFIRDVAELVASLQVPMSLGHPVLLPVHEPWEKLFNLSGFGWESVESLEVVFHEVLKGNLDYV